MTIPVQEWNPNNPRALTRTGGRANPSTAVRAPWNDRTPEGIKAENDLLHRRVLMLTHLELRLRAALELATGTPWDSENIVDMHGDELRETVAHAFARGLGMHIDDARER